jgi:hypothetical protein
VIQIYVGGGDAPDYDVLFFGKDADCRLHFLDELSQQGMDGKIAGNAYAQDLPYAKKKDENVGTGTATGIDHREYRIVKGKLKRTVDVKTK